MEQKTIAPFYELIRGEKKQPNQFARQEKGKVIVPAATEGAAKP